MDKKIFFRNSARSTKYMVDDLLKRKFPATYDMVHIKKSVSNVNEEIRKLDLEARRIEEARARKMPEIKGDFISNAISDIKTGNFYNKKRIKAMNEDFEKANSFDLDFLGSLDNMTSSFGSLSGAITKQSNLNVMVAKTQMKASRQDTMFANAASRQRHLQSLELSNTMNQNLVNLVQFNNMKIAPFMDQTLNYYQDSIYEQRNTVNILKDIRDMQVTMYRNDGSQALLAEKTKLEKMFKGGSLNVAEYYKSIRHNIRDIDGLGGILTALTGAGDGKKSAVIDYGVSPSDMHKLTASPVSHVISQITNTFGLPRELEKSLRTLESTITGLPAAFLLSVMNIDKSAGFNRVMEAAANSRVGRFFDFNRVESMTKLKTNTSSFIKSIFGVSNDSDYHLDKFNRGAIAFNGVTQKAITSVIPSLLGKIYGAITRSNEDIVVDYNRGGKIMTATDRRKEIDQIYSSSAASSMPEFNQHMNRMIMATNMNADKRDQINTELGKLNVWLSKGNKLDINNPNFIDELKKISPDNANYFFSLLKQLPIDVMNKLPFNQLLAQMARTTVSKQLEHDADANGLAMLEAWSDYKVSSRKILLDDVARQKTQQQSQQTIFSPDELDDLNSTDIGEILAVRIDPTKARVNPEQAVLMRSNRQKGLKGLIREIIGAPMKATSYMINGFSKLMNRLIYGKEQDGKGLIEGLYDRFNGFKNRAKEWAFAKADQARNKWNESEFGQYVNGKWNQARNWMNGENENGFGAGFKNAWDSVWGFGKEAVGNTTQALFGENTLMGSVEYMKRRVSDLGVYLFGNEEKSGLFHKAYIDDFRKLGFDATKIGQVLGSSAVGYLGGLFLPGGPLLWSLFAGSNSFVNASEKLKKTLFGDPEAETEGLIPKELLDVFPNIKKGTGIGLVAGLVAKSFLPGGPITGAIVGSMLGYMKDTDVFQRLFFGKDKNGDKTQKGLIDKVKDTLYDTIGGKVEKFIDTQVAKFTHTFDKYLFNPIKSAIRPAAKAFMRASTKMVTTLAKMMDNATGGLMSKLSKMFLDLGKGVLGGATSLLLMAGKATGIVSRTSLKASGTGIKIGSTLLAKYGMDDEEYQAWKEQNKERDAESDRRYKERMSEINGKSYKRGDNPVVDQLNDNNKEMKSVVEKCTQDMVNAIHGRGPGNGLDNKQIDEFIGLDIEEQQQREKERHQAMVLEEIAKNTSATAAGVEKMGGKEKGNTFWDTMKSMAMGIWSMVSKLGPIAAGLATAIGLYNNVKDKMEDGKTVEEALTDTGVDIATSSRGVKTIKKIYDGIVDGTRAATKMGRTAGRFIKSGINRVGRVSAKVMSHIKPGSAAALDDYIKGSKTVTGAVKNAVTGVTGNLKQKIQKYLDDIIAFLCRNESTRKLIEPVSKYVKKALPEVAEFLTRKGSRVISKALGYAEIALIANDIITGAVDYRTILEIPADTPYDPILSALCCVVRTINGAFCFGLVDEKWFVNLVLWFMGKGDAIKLLQDQYNTDMKEKGFGDNRDAYRSFENATMWQKMGRGIGIVDSKRDLVKKELEILQKELESKDPSSEEYKSIELQMENLNKTLDDTFDTWYESLGNTLSGIIKKSSEFIGDVFNDPRFDPTKNKNLNKDTINGPAWQLGSGGVNTRVKTATQIQALNGMGGDETSSKTMFPVPDGTYRISSGYGNRVFRGKTEFHDGVDLAAPEGTDIYAARPGKVYKAAISNQGFGNHIRVKHYDGFETLYAHASKLNVKEGDTVSAGQKIGEVGTTGNSTGNHLHFAVYDSSKVKGSVPKYGEGIEPMSWLQSASTFDPNTIPSETTPGATFDASATDSYDSSLTGMMQALGDWFSELLGFKKPSNTNQAGTSEIGSNVQITADGTDVTPMFDVDIKEGDGTGLIDFAFLNNSKKEKFLEAIQQGAIDGYKEHRVLPSLTLAQGALESGWGKKAIANNIFGIKADSRWTGPKVTKLTSEQDKYGNERKEYADFRAYSSVAESVKDHAKFLAENSRYKKVLNAKNYKEANRLIQEAEYATDINYAKSLDEMVEYNKLYKVDNLLGLGMGGGENRIAPKTNQALVQMNATKDAVSEGMDSINATLDNYYRNMSDTISDTVSASSISRNTGIDTTEIVTLLREIAKNTKDGVLATTQLPEQIAEVVSEVQQTIVSATSSHVSSGSNVFLSQVDNARTTATNAMRSRVMNIAKGN